MARAAMTQMLRLQIAAVAVMVTSLVLARELFIVAIPTGRMVLIDAALAIFLITRLASIVHIRRRRGTIPDTPYGWYGNTLAGFWMMAVLVVTAVWLAMPFIGETRQLLAVLFSQAPATVAAIGTVRRPGDSVTWRAAVIPGVIPAGIIGYFIVYGGAFALPVIIFLLMFAGLLFLLRSTLQRGVTQVWLAKADADAQRDMRARFLASASHDLGQPLQSARLFFYQAVRGTDPDRRETAIENANAAFDAVERQLNDINEHLRLEDGTIVARSISVPVSAAIAHVATLAGPAAEAAGVAIHTVPSRHLVAADPDLLARALSNLVNNALRHAKARRVLIGAQRRADRVRLWVIDDGVGVDTGDAPRLFDAYVQGSDHGDEMRGGFGLGLASVRRIAALMAGSAGFEARWQAGAAFYLELPSNAILAAEDAELSDL